MKPSARFGGADIETPQKLDIQIEEEKFQTEKAPKLQEMTIEKYFTPESPLEEITIEKNFNT